jgi:RteC protein
MRKLIISKQCRLIYKSLQQEIQGCQSELSDEVKWIEKGFGITMQAWLNIEKITDGYRFIDQQEEVYFYKTLKPRFTGLIDYFILLYKSVLFQPDDYTEKEAYWRSERKSCSELISRFKTACLHYEQQQPDTDIYFLQHNNQQPLIYGINVSHFDLTSISYGYLLGRLIAMKKYKKFMQKKINTSTLETCKIAA